MFTGKFAKIFACTFLMLTENTDSADECDQKPSFSSRYSQSPTPASAKGTSFLVGLMDGLAQRVSFRINQLRYAHFKDYLGTCLLISYGFDIGNGVHLYRIPYFGELSNISSL